MDAVGLPLCLLLLLLCWRARLLCANGGNAIALSHAAASAAACHAPLGASWSHGLASRHGHASGQLAGTQPAL